MQLLYISLHLLLLQYAAAKPKDPHRPHDHDLSEASHEADGKHDSNYDHDAFLGRKEAQRFDELTPEESKNRLGKLYDKIDKDSDGFVTYQELHDWIKQTSKRYLIEDRDRVWGDYNKTSTELLDWETYVMKLAGEEDDDEDDAMKEILEKDMRRWKVADLDGDNKLNKEEFLDFLHPEEADRMRGIVIDETMNDLDLNKDGYIDVEEFINDMWQPNEDSEPEPDWVKSEREQFGVSRDSNGDGKLDRQEVEAWVLPKDYDHVDSEAKHLIAESDGDGDGKLTKQEVVDHHDLFVGSQATDFGQAFTSHDEL